jgi:hypothetical protein
MASFISKNSSNYPFKYQTLNYGGGASGGATVFTTTFGPETQQIRVLSQVGGWGSIDQSTSSITVTSGSGSNTGMLLAANTAQGDYFTVRPGQFFSFCSTTTSSGSISCTEMA